METDDEVLEIVVLCTGWEEAIEEVVSLLSLSKSAWVKAGQQMRKPVRLFLSQL